MDVETPIRNEYTERMNAEAKTTVAVLGLGAMGSRMAKRLLDQGFAVRVYNRTAARGEALGAAGARVAATAADAARGADAVLSMVTDDEAARRTWLDPERGALTTTSAGAVAIECSTATPSWGRELEARARAKDIAFVEAPVVGSRPQAEAGQLVHLVGGEPAAVERARPILAALGRAAHHVGEAGRGAAMKLVVNALFGAQVAALGEMLGLATRSGIDLEAALAVLGTLPTTSPALVGVGALVRSADHAPRFPIELVAKDFRYAVQEAAGLGLETPVITATGRAFEDAAAAGLGAENISAIARRSAP